MDPVPTTRLLALALLAAASLLAQPCPTKSPTLTGPQWNGWSPTATNTRFQPADAARLSLDQVRNLELKWAWGFEDDQIVFSQATVAGDTLFIGSNSGRVHALDTKTGCTRWMFRAPTGVRTSIVVAPLAGGKHAILLGDRAGMFYALDAASGRELWKKQLDPHPATRLTGAPVINGTTVYVPVASYEEGSAREEGYICCTFRGSMVALNIADGKLLWQTYTITEKPQRHGDAAGPSGAGIWSAPTLDLKRGRIYATTGDNYSEPDTPLSDAVLAFDLKTGKIVWSQQTVAGDIFNGYCQPLGTCPGPDYDFGASAILAQTEDGRDLLLAGQKSGMVYALDPDANGKIVWQERVGKGGVNGGVQWGMAADGRNLYAANSDVGRRPGTFYDPSVGGGLTALHIADGKQAWYAPPVKCNDVPGCSPAQSNAVTVIPGVVFSGALDGHIRAYAAEDGKILWDFDTVRDFDTVNKIPAKGGGVDGPGAVVVNGMVFVGSGYERTGGLGGNVLLAFGPPQ